MVSDKTNEITAVHALLESLVLDGTVVTVDALLTQRDVAQAILDKGGDARDGRQGQSTGSARRDSDGL